MARSQLLKFFAARDPANTGKAKRRTVDRLLKHFVGDSSGRFHPYLDMITDKGTQMTDYNAFLDMIFSETEELRQFEEVQTDQHLKELLVQCATPSNGQRSGPSREAAWTLSTWLDSLRAAPPSESLIDLLAETIGGSLDEDARFRFLQLVGAEGDTALVARHLTTNGLVEALAGVLLQGARDLNTGVPQPRALAEKGVTASRKKVVDDMISHIQMEARFVCSSWKAEESLLKETGIIFEDRIRTLERTLSEISGRDSVAFDDDACFRSAVEGALEAKQRLTTDVCGAHPIRSAAYVLKLLGAESCESVTCQSGHSLMFALSAQRYICSKCSIPLAVGSVVYACGCPYRLCEDCALTPGAAAAAAKQLRKRQSGTDLEPYIRLLSSRLLASDLERDTKLRCFAEEALTALLGGGRAALLGQLRKDSKDLDAVKAALPGMVISRPFQLGGRQVKEQRITVADLKGGLTPSETVALLGLQYDQAKALLDVGLAKASSGAKSWALGERIVLEFSDGVGYFDKVTKVTKDEVTTSNFGLNASTGAGFYVKCQAFALEWA